MAEVRHAPERDRYEVLVAGEVAGFVTYRRHGDRYVFEHTIIKEGYAGQGLATVLARGALDDVRAHGRRMVAVCEFVQGFLAKNPQYGDLVDAALAEQFGAATRKPDDSP